MDGGTTRPPATTLVLVRFHPDEFLRRYPASDSLAPEDVFRPMELEGLRSSNALLPQRLKDFVRAELQLPLERVVVVSFDRKPMQREQALSFAATMVVVTLVGALWVVQRFRTRPAPPPMAE